MNETKYNFKPIDQGSEVPGVPPSHPDYEAGINYSEGKYYEEGMKIVHELRDAGLEGHLINNGFSGFNAVVTDESEEQYQKMIEIFERHSIPTEKYDVPKIEHLKQQMKEEPSQEKRMEIQNSITQLRENKFPKTMEGGFH